MLKLNKKLYKNDKNTTKMTNTNKIQKIKSKSKS